MKKLMILLLASILLFSCQSTKDEGDDYSLEKAEVKTNTPKVKGAEGVMQPDWVVGAADDSDFYYGVGSGKAANRINSRKIAKIDASADLASRVQQQVERLSKNVIKDNETYSQAEFNETTMNLVNASLTGVAYVDEWLGPDETVYVLASIPKENLEIAVKNLLQSKSAEDLKELFDDIEDEIGLTGEETKEGLIEKVRTFLFGEKAEK